MGVQTPLFPLKNIPMRTTWTRREKMIFGFMVIGITLIIFLLSSCSSTSRATRQLKKAERALKKAEQLGADISADTVWKTLDVPVPYVSTDTVFKSQEGDTVFIEKDRLKVKYVDLPADSVYIYGECQADTVRIETPVTVYKEISAGYTLWELIILGIAVAAVALVIGMFIQGRRSSFHP